MMPRRRSLERRLVWIFGAPRSGSTWLANLLLSGGKVTMLDEPNIGVHLGVTLTALHGLEPRQPPERPRLDQARAELSDYFFSSRHENAWRRELRRLILRRIDAQVGRAELAVIKEPLGSQAADIVMSLLPRSYLIFLLRDGRDAIDSELDAVSEGSWAAKLMPDFTIGDRGRYLRDRAYLWLWRTEAVQRAFDAHSPERRWLLRYEEMLEDPVAALRPVARGLRLDEGAISDAAAATTFERLTPDQRGRGQFIRGASQGLWREHLTSEEQSAIHEIIGPKLRELGYE
jgi:hypothetical protein